MTIRKGMKLYIDTLGCPKNENDSEGIAGIWEAAGGEITRDPAEAEVLLVNTCAFINDAKEESIEHIFDMVRLAGDAKAEGRPAKILCVSGCLSERYREDLAGEMSEVDIFLGVNEYEDFPEVIAAFTAGSSSRCCFSETPEGFREFSARKLSDTPYTATLRIAEGCNNRCAYCVIPSIRGRFRSRPEEKVVEEAERLAAAGCRELILIAQDLTEYGRDLYGELRLPQLLKKLCAVDGIRWIRLMYCYEDKITDELIRVIAEENKICNYMDIPLQHVSDDVLRRMRRRSTEGSIRSTITRLRSAIPDFHIRTTFITGFPGETEEDFDRLSAFAEEMKLERLGVFAYSREEGTLAGDMEDQIDEEIRRQRADSIMRHQVDISRSIGEKKIGTIQEVLVEGEENGAWIGRTRYDAPGIDGNVVFTAPGTELHPGDMVWVKITDAFDYDLAGEMTAGEEKL